MISTLPNGLTICTRPMEGVETATLTLLAKCGSRDEPAALNGIAHLFEHMVFKGAGERSARQISEAIEDVGGELNACTERDCTSFTASVMAEHVPLAVELLSDLVVRPRLADDDLEREKQVVLQELAEALDTPSDIIFDELWATAFADQPLGRSILGSEETITGISADDLRTWREEHFRPSSLILSAAGKVDHDSIACLAEQLIPPGGSDPVAPSATANFTGSNRIAPIRSEQAHLAFAFPAPALGTGEAIAARLFADAVGSGASSRLFQEVREERGLAYSVSAAIQSYQDCGIFYVHAATARRDGPSASQLIRDVLDQAADDVSARELERCKNQARAGLLMHLETSWGQSSYAARQIATYGRVKTAAEVMAEIESVTLEDVRRAGRAMLSGSAAQASIGMPAARAA